MTMPTLLRQGNPLSDPLHQLQILESIDSSSVPPFEQTLADRGLPGLQSHGIQVLQINVGKRCNQTCTHCHVDAGPERREIMSKEIFEACLRAIVSSNIETVDITGGAPEMNPHFEWFVTEVRRLGKRVIDRCNLTILTTQGFTHLAKFLADQQVEIVASLPCYLEENCDRQRGDGVFAKSINALQLLNSLGYGQAGSNLVLSLVYNPVGPSLPPDQRKLEAAYRDQLRSRFHIEFNQLFTITNMPISRFLDDLLTSGQYDEYMQKLLAAFNPHTIDAVMCRNTLSVDWRGELYDCDFNQMLQLPVSPKTTRTIHTFNADVLSLRSIITGRHCYGCTAGAGSSCQGALLER